MSTPKLAVPPPIRGADAGSFAEHSIPTTPLSSALRFSALTMRDICLVIAPLDPGHEGEALLNGIRMQGQHDFE